MEAGVFSIGNPASLTSLDVACGMPLGWNSSPPPAPHRSSFDEFTTRLFSSSFGRGAVLHAVLGRQRVFDMAGCGNSVCQEARLRRSDPDYAALSRPGLSGAARTPGARDRSAGTGGLGAGRARRGPRPDWTGRHRGSKADGPVVAAARLRDGSAARGGARWRVPTSDRARRLFHLVALGTACERCGARSATDGPRRRVAQRDPDARGLACAGCESTGHAAADAVAATGGRRTRAGAPQDQAGGCPGAMQPRDDGAKHASVLQRRSRHVSCARRGVWYDHGPASVPTRRGRVARRRLWVARIRRSARNSGAAGRRPFTRGPTRRPARSRCDRRVLRRAEPRVRDELERGRPR